MSAGKCYKCRRPKCLDRRPIWVYTSYTHPKEFKKNQSKAFEGAEDLFDDGADMASDIMGELAAEAAKVGGPGVAVAAALGVPALLTKLGLILKELTGFKFSKSLSKSKTTPTISRPRTRKRSGPVVVKSYKGKMGYGPRWMPGTSHRVIMVRRRKVSTFEARMRGWPKKMVCLNCYRKLWGDKAVPPPSPDEQGRIRKMLDEIKTVQQDRQLDRVDLLKRRSPAPLRTKGKGGSWGELT